MRPHSPFCAAPPSGQALNQLLSPGLTTGSLTGFETSASMSHRYVVAARKEALVVKTQRAVALYLISVCVQTVQLLDNV